MNDTSRQIFSVLDAEELSLGRNVIQRIRPDSEDVRQHFRLYRVRTEGLQGSLSEFLAIQQSAVELPQLVITNLIAELKGRWDEAIPTCLVPSLPLPSLPSEVGNVRVSSPECLFAELVKLPHDLADKLIHNRLESVDSRYLDLMQPRRAHVTHDPLAPARGGTRIEDVSTYLAGWAESGSQRHPILLLGERGTGKSWQIINFCLEQRNRAIKAPWLHGPAFYVGLRDLFAEACAGLGGYAPLQSYLVKRYPGLGYLHDLPLLSAFLRAGHTIVCLDGFDEIAYQAPDASVALHMTAVMDMLASSTRALMTSRTSHFRSLDSVLTMRLWSGLTVGEVFEVITLEPLELRYVEAYVAALEEKLGQRAVSQRLTELSDPQTSGDTLAAAFRTCQAHPGILAHFVRRLEQKGTTGSAFDLIAEGIEQSLVGFNLLYGRTVDQYPSLTGEPIDLSFEVRRRLIGELAWYMAERRLDVLRFDELPGKIAKWFRVEDDALVRDMRSQLVFEMVEEAALSKETERRSAESAGSAGCYVRFALRVPLEEAEGDNPVSYSVTFAYFLAGFLEERLLECDPFGRLLDLKQRMGWLGRVPLGRMAATFLRERLRRQQPTFFDQLGQDAEVLILGLAREEGGLRIYSPRYRYLCENLVSMGVLSEERRTAIDPWVESTLLILRPPGGLPGCQMVLVPPATQADLHAGAQVDAPFLIGIHEITNELFEEFVLSGEEGRAWSVEEVTVAGSRGSQPPSKYADKTNEYHLYLWMKREMGFRPGGSTRRRPVTYVSWFGAASFCNWLSHVYGLPHFYTSLGVSYDDPRDGGNSGYRLPTAAEWIWTAKGGHTDLAYPWEMYPYYLPRAERTALAAVGDDREGIDPQALRRYREEQAAVEELLLSTGKQSQDVLYDEFSDLGVSGLMGNVKEWCNDLGSGENTRHRIIIGATAYLGRDSFNFKYRMSLFPENTNPDVGFRLARSLTDDQLATLEARRHQIEKGESATRE